VDEANDQTQSNAEYEGGFRSAGVAWGGNTPPHAPATLVDKEPNGRAIVVECQIRRERDRDGSPMNLQRTWCIVINGVANANARYFPCGEEWRSKAEKSVN